MTLPADSPAPLRVEIRKDSPSNPLVASLLAEHLAEQRGSAPPGLSFALDETGLSAPEVTFWTAWLQHSDGDGVEGKKEETLAGFAALKQLGPKFGEVKSMRTTFATRGRGIGRLLLQRVVDEAKARGYDRISLETGPGEAYAAASALYEKLGFVLTGPFSDYKPSDYSVYYTLDLSAQR